MRLASNMHSMIYRYPQIRLQAMFAMSDKEKKILDKHVALHKE